MTIAIHEDTTNQDMLKIAVEVTDPTEVATIPEDLGKSLWEFETSLTILILMVWIWRVECKTEWAKADQGEKEFDFSYESLKNVRFFIRLIYLENMLHILKTGPRTIPWKHL